MILPAALIQIIIFQAVSFMQTFNIFLPLTEAEMIWAFGLIIDIEKHKCQHSEEVEAGPVPFLPFSSSSSVLLQLSVEPWETETSNKAWVDRRTKGGATARQTGWNGSDVSCGWACLDTLLIRTHRQPDGQTGWTDDSLPGAQTSQHARIRAATCDCCSVQRVCKSLWSFLQ